MIEFNRVGILKLSITEEDLPGNGKCQAARESLEISCWNLSIDTFQGRLDGIKDDPNTAENEGQIRHSSLYLMVSLPRAEYYMLWFFLKLVIRREEERPEQWTANYLSVPSLCLLKREFPELLPWTCHLKATLSLCFLAGGTFPFPTLPNLSQMVGLVMVAWL